MTQRYAKVVLKIAAPSPDDTIKKDKHSRAALQWKSFVGVVFLVFGASWYVRFFRGSSSEIRMEERDWQIVARKSKGNVVMEPPIRHLFDCAKDDVRILPLSPNSTKAGRLFFWMMPSFFPRGVLFHFHGCHHGAADFFLLPEDRLVAYSALSRGLLVVSVESQNIRHGCWDRSTDLEDLKKDTDRLFREIETRFGFKGLATLPRVGIGASSGASFLFDCWKELNFTSMASYIHSRFFTNDEMDRASTADGYTPLPATVFVYMSVDQRVTKSIARGIDTIKKRVGADTPFRRIEIQPHKLTSALCRKRLPELGEVRCNITLNKIQQHVELMDWEYTVLKSANSLDYEQALAQLDDYQTVDNGVVPDKSFGGEHSWIYAAFAEEINAAFGRHEMVAEARENVLMFLMKHAGIPLLKSGY